MNPGAPAINVRWAALFNSMRTQIDLAIANVVADEELHGRSRRIYRLVVLNAAQQYMMLMYAYITNPYAGESDWDAVKTLYNWTAMKKCFACSSGLNLETYATLLQLETLCETGIDIIND